MNASLSLLQELQKLETHAQPTPEQQQRITELRTLIPAPVLAHYHRMIVNRTKPIAEVRRGICGGCHLRLASWIRQAAHDDDLHLCENCGAYLVFVPGEPPSPPKSSRSKQARLAVIRAAVAR